MQTLRGYVIESKTEKLDPKEVFKNIDKTSGVLCPIHLFIKHLKEGTNIKDKWNPNDYIDTMSFNNFTNWVQEEWPAALMDDHEDELFVLLGTTYENPDMPQVDVIKVTDLLNQTLGHQTGGGGVKASCFGPIGIGYKYFYSHYWGQGKAGLLEKGCGSKIGNRQINWSLFLDSDTLKNYGLIK